ncbi:MAG: pilus assembly protein TadG-related protein [Micrococcales bacterium]|nr:pilus assembly protein TadG-related protein [Micrococcales bacterium]
MRVFRRQDDRGAANLMIIPAIMGLLIVTLLVIRNIGSATDDSRQARTAADAAALAAAKVWSDNMERDFDAATGAGEGDDVSVSSFRGSQMSSYLTGAAAAASAYAAANNAYLVGAPQFDTTTGTVTVTVRNTDTVPDTGQRMEHSATAQVKFPPTSGACVTRGTLGYRTGRLCDTSEDGGLPDAPYRADIELVR